MDRWRKEGVASRVFPVFTQQVLEGIAPVPVTGSDSRVRAMSSVPVGTAV